MHKFTVVAVGCIVFLMGCSTGESQPPATAPPIEDYSQLPAETTVAWNAEDETLDMGDVSLRLEGFSEAGSGLADRMPSLTKVNVEKAGLDGGLFVSAMTIDNTAVMIDDGATLLEVPWQLIGLSSSYDETFSETFEKDGLECIAEYRYGAREDSVTGEPVTTGMGVVLFKGSVTPTLVMVSGSADAVVRGEFTSLVESVCR